MGAREVVPAVWSLIEDADSDLPEALRPIFAEACREIREIEGRIKRVERQLEATAKQPPAVEYPRTIPGIGLLIATALVAFLGDVRRFPSARHLASYLGLTPREYSSGLKRHLGGSPSGEMGICALCLFTERAPCSYTHASSSQTASE